MLAGTMRRRDKGRVAPPPRLPAAAQRVADDVAALPGVTVQAHWEIGSQTDVNGTDFYIEEEELGHIHLDGEAHIPFSPALGRAVIAAKLARKFRWNAAFVVVDTADRAVAFGLFALRHAELMGATNGELRARIAAVR
jgi:hypothetical protein